MRAELPSPTGFYSDGNGELAIGSAVSTPSATPTPKRSLGFMMRRGGDPVSPTNTEGRESPLQQRLSARRGGDPASPTNTESRMPEPPLSSRLSERQQGRISGQMPSLTADPDEYAFFDADVISPHDRTRDSTASVGLSDDRPGDESPSSRRSCVQHVRSGGSWVGHASTGGRSPSLRQQSYGSESHRDSNARSAARIRAFENRRSRLTGEFEEVVRPRGEDQKPMSPDSYGQEALEDVRQLVPGELGVEVDIKEVEAHFGVVSCSSAHPEYPATELLALGGCWETVAGHVIEQSVVLEIKGQQPTCISGVSFGLPGTDAGPHHCGVFYSRGCADGPWREAWRFDVASKIAPTFKTNHNYESQKRVEEFLNVLHNSFSGGIDEAWTKALDVNRDGMLSFTEFVQACSRVRTVAPTRDVNWHNDLQQLFGLLDEDKSGSVRVDDLKRMHRENSSQPEAAWWKLVIFRNWGSPKRLQLAGPLKIFTLVEEVRSAHHDQELQNMLTSNFGASKHSVVTDLTTAFSLEVLDVDPKAIMLRNLAKKHNLTILELEDLHELFKEVDVDSSGSLEEATFINLIMTLHGAVDLADIPMTRLHFFWQQADADNSGEVDFPEFVRWFKRYAPDIDLRKVSFSKKTSLKSSMCQNRKALVRKHTTGMYKSLEGRAHEEQFQQTVNSMTRRKTNRDTPFAGLAESHLLAQSYP